MKHGRVALALRHSHQRQNDACGAVVVELLVDVDVKVLLDVLVGVDVLEEVDVEDDVDEESGRSAEGKHSLCVTVTRDKPMRVVIEAFCDSAGGISLFVAREAPDGTSSVGPSSCLPF